MTIRVAPFAGEFAALAEWTGQLEEELRQDEDYRAPGREYWPGVAIA